MRSRIGLFLILLWGRAFSLGDFFPQAVGDTWVYEGSRSDSAARFGGFPYEAFSAYAFRATVRIDSMESTGDTVRFRYSLYDSLFLRRVKPIDQAEVRNFGDSAYSDFFWTQRIGSESDDYVRGPLPFPFLTAHDEPDSEIVTIRIGERSYLGTSGAWYPGSSVVLKDIGLFEYEGGSQTNTVKVTQSVRLLRFNSLDFPPGPAIPVRPVSRTRPRRPVPPRRDALGRADKDEAFPSRTLFRVP